MDELGGLEIFWREHYIWLQGQGYQLRPRYHPEWVPSWKKNKKFDMDCEDGHPLIYAQINDAIQISTGSRVVIKLSYRQHNPLEEDIIRYLSSEDLSKDPRNHCIPILDVLHPPLKENPEGIRMLVMPFLRPFRLPRFDTVGEVVDCVRQLMETVQFMHANHVAHRDINVTNYMMESVMFPEGHHPVTIDLRPDVSGPAKYFTRTQRPPKYFLIDFGLSRKYEASNTTPLEDIIIGGDSTVPEFQNSLDPQNPFMTDIYYTGNLIREEFMDGHPISVLIRGYEGLEFLRPLINDMVQSDPVKRPTIDEALRRFNEIVLSLSTWKLRSRVKYRKTNPFREIGLSISHWRRRMIYIIRRTPAIPSS